MKIDIKRPMEDPTLAAADAALEARGAERQARGYLGMSGIGGCQRKSFYQFIMAGVLPFPFATLKKFEDGFRTEDLTIDRLRAVLGLTLIDRDIDTGRQIAVHDFDGHYRGHLDFEVLGLLQAPKTWHVGECKAVSDKVFAEFKRLKEKHGEKDTLENWNQTYYAQAQSYMLYRKRKRHWMVVSTAGGREWDSCRTDFNKEKALVYVERARRIIYDRVVPPRISDNKDYWLCRICESRAVCHGGKAPKRNCRTCIHADPVEDSGWRCTRHDKPLSMSDQMAGCGDQRYKPELVPGEVKYVDDRDNTVVYKLNNGQEWADDGK
jgi:hypothetical protein